MIFSDLTPAFPGEHYIPWTMVAHHYYYWDYLVFIGQEKHTF